MATLTYKVRLGITKGWRVRSLNQVKFYVQTVAHCLFIFTSLRFRGYQDKIWTLNYTVFLMKSKYLIYIEFLVLPRARKWARGYGKSLCFGFTTRIRLKINTRIVKFTPNIFLGRLIRTGFKKARAKTLQGSVWIWGYKMTLVKALLRMYSSDAHLSVLGAVNVARGRLLRSTYPWINQSSKRLLHRFRRGLFITPNRRLRSIIFSTRTPLLLRGTRSSSFKKVSRRLSAERKFLSTKPVRKILRKFSLVGLTRKKEKFSIWSVFQPRPKFKKKPKPKQWGRR